MNYCPEGEHLLKAWQHAFKVYCATAPKDYKQAAEEYFRAVGNCADHFEQCPICQEAEKEKKECDRCDECEGCRHFLR